MSPASEARMYREESKRVVADLLDGGLEIDLGERLTRADVGLSDGRNDAILALRDGVGEPFQVKVHFPDGRVLETDASDVVVVATGPDGPPKSLSITRRRMSDNDLRAALAEAARRFNVDTAKMDSFAKDWRQRRASYRTTRVLYTDIETPVQFVIVPVGERPEDGELYPL